MSQASDEKLLAFLEGSLDEHERAELLDALDRSPELAARLRSAAKGLDVMRTYAASVPRDREKQTTSNTRVSPWWIAVAAAVTLIFAVPITWWVARDQDVPIADTTTDAGRPETPAPSFVLILHGRWPDAGAVNTTEAQARAREYWGWTSSLANDGVLVAAGDLRWEPGERLGPSGVSVTVAADEVERTDYVVGMFILRAESYEEALAVARECPHLRYGGSVSVRRVGAGFVTVRGMSDWSG